MNAPAILSALPDSVVPGTRLDNGDWLLGRIQAGNTLFAITLPPIAIRRHDNSPWSSNSDRVDGALSFFDGVANTDAMAKAGSELATYARDNGLHVPALDELELAYRHFKPTTDRNYLFREGVNPSSVPPGQPYTEEFPQQTELPEFRKGGEEALPVDWVWSSTQCQHRVFTHSAWVQHFGYGSQSFDLKSDSRAVVLVRRFIIR